MRRPPPAGKRSPFDRDFRPKVAFFAIRHSFDGRPVEDRRRIGPNRPTVENWEGYPSGVTLSRHSHLLQFSVYSGTDRRRPFATATPDLRCRLVDEVKEIRMIRRSAFLLALMLAAVVLPLRAQTGCADSPEDPTLVLALVGGAGVLVASLRASRSRKR